MKGRTAQTANSLAAEADDKQTGQRGDGRIGEVFLALGGDPEIRQQQRGAEGDYAQFKCDQGSVHQLRTPEISACATSFAGTVTFARFTTFCASGLIFEVSRDGTKPNTSRLTSSSA